MDKKNPVHIFIVDNQRLFVELLDYIFSKDISLRFLDFKSGEDCLRNLQLHPEIIVLNYRLPGMNGFETLLEIREQNPDAYVLMLLNPDDGRLPAEFLNAGANDYLLDDGQDVSALIQKIELRLKVAEGPVKSGARRSRSLKQKLYYALLALLLATAGFYVYQ